MRHRQSSATPPKVDDLDDLQLVTRREFRRGYKRQVDGRPMRLRYRKIMKTPDGMLLVCRPPAGEERFQITLSEFGKAFGVFLLMIWPFTIIGTVVLVAVLVAALR